MSSFARKLSYYTLMYKLNSLIGKCQCSKFSALNGFGSDALDEACAYLRVVACYETFDYICIKEFKDLTDLFEKAVEIYKRKYMDETNLEPGAYESYMETLSIATEFLMLKGGE